MAWSASAWRHRGSESMSLWVYCICRNEQHLMGYFLRHYATLADKIIIYDDQSDDGTREIVKACPIAELRDWPGTHGLVDDEFLEFANKQWREAIGKAHWVAWVDVDEFLYHPDMRELLASYVIEGVDIPRIEGYGMVSDHFPTTTGQIYDEIKTGFRSPEWDKHELFHAAVKMVWNIGRHSFWDAVMGKFRMSDRAEIKLLHYRYLGLEYVEARNNRNHSRQPDRCRRLSFGDNCCPDATKTYSTNWFREFGKQPFPNVI